ncbi:MAG: NAD(P)/FAD-dependent oxidoreductase [Thermoplasmataceae archaeon]
MPVKADKETDILIIGGGVLGTTISYWLSTLTDMNITILDKNHEPGMETTLRNTGVLHRPFYLDPSKKKVFAVSAEKSWKLWECIAAKGNLPWLPTGTIEIAKTEKDLEKIYKYEKWAIENGMSDDEFKILNKEELTKNENMVVGEGGFHSKKDYSTNFSLLTKYLSDYVKNKNVNVIGNTKVEFLSDKDSIIGIRNLDTQKKTTMTYKLLINAAGSNSLNLAHKADLGKDLAVLYFRGEYLKVSPTFGSVITKNIYTVPANLKYPFLDPHFIIKSNGSKEIGPNAVMVASPYSYNGSGIRSGIPIKSLIEKPLIVKMKLLRSSEFVKLVLKEWRSSFSKRFMVERIREFIPKINISDTVGSGISGIRGQVIDSKGFLSEARIIFGNSSVHIVNYNSPGATGAPVYSRYVLSELEKNGFLKLNKNNGSSLWEPKEAEI